jgi:glycosyltransferase involved in cell wall biosynthesis
MFHETYVDMRSFSWALMGSWQRVQLVAIQATSDVQLCSSQRYTNWVRRTAVGRAVHHLPVASNLPDARANRQEARCRLGVDGNTLVLSCMGLRQPQRLQSYVLAAAQAAGTVARSVLLIDLGPGDRSIDQIDDNVFLRHTGFLDAHEVACHLAASDLFLAPYTDGISTRRTSMMAALQHGVAVVGTASEATDDVLRDRPGLVLVNVGSPHRFARAVTETVTDARRVAELGASARSLYERHFDWPVLTDRLRTYIDV